MKTLIAIAAGALLVAACGPNAVAPSPTTTAAAGATAAGAGTVPSVAITAPAAGATVPAGQEVLVDITATDTAGVSRVDLQADAIVVDTFTTPAPAGDTSVAAELRWTPTAPGAHALTVIAYRPDGTASAPAVRAILVSGAGASGPSGGSVPPPVSSSPVPGATATPGPVITVSPPSPTPARPTATPGATTPPVPVASIGIRSIGLEDPSSTDGHGRALEFTSEGPGQVSIAVSHVMAPGRKVQLCLQRETRPPFCRITSKITLFGTTTRSVTHWRVTLKGADSGYSSSADLDLAFPATKPLVRGRTFYISGSRTMHGLTIDLTPEVSCSVGSAYPNLTNSTMDPTRKFKDLTDPAGPLAAPTTPGCPGATDLGSDGTASGLYYTGLAHHTYEFTYIDETTGDDAWVDFLIAWSNPASHP